MKNEKRKLKSAAPKISFAEWLKREKWSVAVLALALALFITACVILYRDTGSIFQPTANSFEGITYESAEILAISEDTVGPHTGVPASVETSIETGRQMMTVKLTSGVFKGTEVTAENNVGVFSSQKHSVGDKIIVCQYAESDDTTGEAVFAKATVYSPNRTWAILLVLVLFFAVTALVGGKTGLKSLLGLAVTIVCIIWILCPMLMKGAAMVPAALGICVFVTVVSFVILGGLHRKTVCAIAGTVAGMALAALFGLLAARLCRVTSFSMYDTDSTLEEFYNMELNGIPIHITGLMTAGILISALGAVMDVAMSLSSSMSELKTVNEKLTVKELWKSGMRIGRDMVGTMTNTLILAFVGSSMILIIWMWSLKPSFYQLTSSNFFAVEIISSVASSVGVILAVPLTAAIAAVFYGAEPDKAKKTAGITGTLLGAGGLVAAVVAMIQRGTVKGNIAAAKAGDLEAWDWINGARCAETRSAMLYWAIAGAALTVCGCICCIAAKPGKEKERRLPVLGLVLCGIAVILAVIVFCSVRPIADALP